MKNEKIIASIQTFISVGILVTALAGIQKHESETDTIPIYMFDATSIQNTTPIPFSKKQFPEQSLPKSEVQEEPIYSEKPTEEKPIEATTKTNGTTDSNRSKIPSQNVYPSSQSFSSFYSKSDYHYEEAAKLTQKPKIISKGTFIYPQKAWDRDIEGTYKARLWVDITGTVVKIEVLDVDDTFGFASAIQKMGKTFKYEPVIVRGQPVPFTIVVPFEFSLN